MTTNYHTPITTGAAANSSVVNSPLAQLDAELSDQSARITVVEGDIPVPSGVPTEYFDGSGGFSVPAGTGAGVDGHLVQDEGVDLPQRAALNFVGAGVTVTNETGGTQVDIPGGGHVIQDEGVDQTQRAKINFTGANVAIVDTAGATEVQVSGVGADGWVADVNTWTPYVRTQAYTNDPAIGVSVVLNMANTSSFIVGSDVAVSSSAGTENTRITAVVANVSITVYQLLFNHTTTSPLVTLLDTFTIAGDVTAIIQKAALLKWTQTTVKYGVVFSSVYNAPNTYITMIHNTDFALTTAAISANYYSYLPDPAGYPGWFNFDAVPQGWSSLPTDVTYKYRTVGRTIYTFIGQVGAGVSNSTTMTFLSPLLITGATHSSVNSLTTDNDITLTTPGKCNLNSTQIIVARKDMGTGAWTASGGKRVSCMIFGEW